MDIDQVERATRELLHFKQKFEPALSILAESFAKEIIEQKDAEIEALKSDIATKDADLGALREVESSHGEQVESLKARAEDAEGKLSEADATIIDLKQQLETAPNATAAPAPVVGPEPAPVAASPSEPAQLPEPGTAAVPVVAQQEQTAETVQQVDESEQASEEVAAQKAAEQAEGDGENPATAAEQKTQALP